MTHTSSSNACSILPKTQRSMSSRYSLSTSSGSISAPLQEFSVGKGARLDLAVLNDGNDKSTMLHLSKGTVERVAR